MTKIDRLIGEFEQAARDHEHCMGRGMAVLALAHAKRVRSLRLQLKTAIKAATKNAPPRYDLTPRAVEDML